MALRVATSAALVSVAAGTINLAVSDCGDSSYHGHVSSISPTSVEQGTATVVTGSGTLDLSVSDGSFSTNVKAAGVTLTSCKGDLCSASKCALPAGTGSVDYHGASCPLAAGPISLEFDVSVSKFVPSSLAHLDIDITSEGSAGKLLCAKISTSPAAAVEESVAEGACTSDEQAMLADPQNVGKKANDCGTSSYNIFTGNFNHDKFNECFSASIGISKTCSECYAATGEYGAKNCKADCLLGWCKSGCLSCTEPAQETLATCTGFTPATADPCEDVKVEEKVAEGACTSDEQGMLADPQNVGKKANDCGTSSYNIFTGNFNHDKFNECFSASIGISKTCSECYAATGEYGAKNCKADCLLGWCKSGCLSCTEPAQETLATCTGFTPATADPCEDVKVEEKVTEGACTSDEQGMLADPQNVGKKANDCGTSSYNIFTGNFNHDKFNECFSASIGISKTCSECYAATGEYGAKNCKADCLLGWCKSGCLSCTEPAQETLATCTGFTPATADPCEDFTV